MTWGAPKPIGLARPGPSRANLSVSGQEKESNAF